MSALPILDYASTPGALLPLPTRQPVLLTLDEVDQALETVGVVLEEAERLQLLALATRIQAATMQAVTTLDELRQLALDPGRPLWEITHAANRTHIAAKDVQALVRSYTKRLAQRTGH